MPPLRLRLRGDRGRLRTPTGAIERGSASLQGGALQMSHDFSLAQSHAFQLARTLMVPVTLFQVDGAFGVLPSDELDDADVVFILEYDPYQFGPAH
jgi:hypothetical protein